MNETHAGIKYDELDPQLQVMVEEIGLRSEAQKRVLTRQVAKLQAERGEDSTVVDAVEKKPVNESAYA